MEGYFIDIHCHPTMRTMHNAAHTKNPNHWEENFNDVIDSGVARWASKTSDRIAKKSQSNFNHCISGKVRVVFDSLYPLERGFVNLRKLPERIIGLKNAETIIVTSAGLSKKQFRKYRSSQDYFKELEEQYDFLIKNQGPSPCGNYSYKVVNNNLELEEWLSAEKGNIAIVVTIEGAHVFGCGTSLSENLDTDELGEKIIENIRIVKAWKHPPFFVTFAHHFWNQLCGHAATFPISTRITCNQNPGLNTGFTELGKKIMTSLLSKENGKRILLDTRHMSAQSRIEYYNYIKDYNQNNPKDPIPIISSHSAVNGYGTMAKSMKTMDNASKKKRTPFCSWSLNVSKEEAQIIHRSGGIVGIILDKGRHSGTNKLKQIDSLSELSLKKEAFIQLILDNIFFYIDAIGEMSAWDMLTLGTDFDGVITHFDCYENMSKMPELKNDLINYLNRTKYRDELWYSYTPEEIFDKIFYSNAKQFLAKHFI